MAKIKLTKRQRHSTYKQALKELLKCKKKWKQTKDLPRHGGLCYYISDIAGKRYDTRIGGNYILMKILFPEFWSKKPKNTWEKNSNWWWKMGFPVRIKALNKCIAETAPKPRKK